MNFTNPTTSLLSTNTTHTSQTFTTSITRLTSTTDLLTPTFGPRSSHILIGHTLTLTQLPQTIFNILPVTHESQIIIKNYIEKMKCLGDGSTGLVILAGMVARNVAGLVSRGLNRHVASDVLKDILKEMDSGFSGKFWCGVEDLESRASVENVVRGVLKDESLMRVFCDAVEIVRIDNETGDSEVENKVKLIQQVKKSECIEHNKTYEDSLVKILDELDDRIRIIKVPTGNTKYSYTLPGMVFPGEALTNTKTCQSSRTHIFSCPIEISRTDTKGVVLLKTAGDLLNFSTDEEENIRQTVKNIVTVDNSVVICSGKVEDLFLDYLNMYGVLVYNLPSKHDIRRVRNLVGGSVSPLLRKMQSEETGVIKEIKVLREGDRKYTHFCGRGVATIMVKSSIKVMADEHERMLSKAVKVLQKNYNKDKHGVEMVMGSGDFERNVASVLVEASREFEDSKRLVYKCVCDALEEMAVKKGESVVYDLYDVKMKMVQYAIDICCIILETEDHFFVREAMNVKPRTNPNWDMD